MNDVAREQVVSSQDIYQGRILSLAVETVRLPNGRETRREIVSHPGAVVIVAVDDRRQVALVRQYRSAIRRVTLEVPAGTREPAEDPADCAARELREEMGVSARQWHGLVNFYSSPGYCTELLMAYVALGLNVVPGEPEDDESIGREWAPLTEIPVMVARGDIVDAKSIASLLTFLLLEQTGAAPWRV